MESRKREFDFTAAGQDSIYSPDQDQRTKIVHVSELVQLITAKKELEIDCNKNTVCNLQAFSVFQNCSRKQCL